MKLTLEGVDGSGGLGHRGRGESGGRADDGSDDSRLHFDISCYWIRSIEIMSTKMWVKNGGEQNLPIFSKIWIFLNCNLDTE